MLLQPSRAPRRFRRGLHLAMQVGLSHLHSGESGVESLRTLCNDTAGCLLIARTQRLLLSRGTLEYVEIHRVFQHIARFIYVTTTVSL